MNRLLALAASKLPSWLEALTKRQRTAYLKEHPTSKYADMLGGGTAKKIPAKKDASIKEKAPVSKKAPAHQKHLDSAKSLLKPTKITSNEHAKEVMGKMDDAWSELKKASKRVKNPEQLAEIKDSMESLDSASDKIMGKIMNGKGYGGPSPKAKNVGGSQATNKAPKKLPAGYGKAKSSRMMGGSEGNTPAPSSKSKEMNALLSKREVLRGALRSHKAKGDAAKAASTQKKIQAINKDLKDNYKGVNPNSK